MGLGLLPLSVRAVEALLDSDRTACAALMRLLMAVSDCVGGFVQHPPSMQAVALVMKRHYRYGDILQSVCTVQGNVCRTSLGKRLFVSQGTIPEVCWAMGRVRVSGSPSWDPLGPDRFTPLVTFWAG